jgi:molybdenum-dependent DNA-binding transcriptional regulator ModE
MPVGAFGAGGHRRVASRLDPLQPVAVGFTAAVSSPIMIDYRPLIRVMARHREADPGTETHMDVIALKTFIAIVHHGSMTAAARDLGYAQSTLSHHIRSLERRLGVSLFSRASDGLALTAAGRLLLPHAVEVVSVCARAADEVRSLQDR